ncbi:MAG: RNA-binding transcriptional accessory protein [Ruminococcaceae bacterium]|nr:RNA-binding transcriptional accessory protein [Oscillospiraceae bacterium]
MNINETLAKEFSLAQWQIDNTVALIDDDKTIPFIARYRKEQTGTLDDQILREIYDRLCYLRGLEKRKEEVISSITEQGKMTEELEAAILAATALVEVEDLYRPYKQKRRTRASVAKEKGLEPLAMLILEQADETDPSAEALSYIDEEKGVASAEEALSGASDIIAELISDDAVLRKQLRFIISRSGKIASRAADSEKQSVYENYYEYEEPVSKIAGHRVLALNRGEKEEFLKVSLELPEMFGEKAAIGRYVKADNACSQIVYDAAVDGYRRLIFPSLEREVRSALTDEASESAIKVFGSNLRQLLMQPPIKNSTTLGLDPAYRTGCKIAVCDPTGKVLDTTVVYPTPPQNKTEDAKRKLSALIKKHGVNTISIGNGTASRESEAFVAELIKEIPERVSYMVVSEAGASVYSASKLAAAEFPEFDVSLRSAVSIARRLQDPLSELVKIEPKAIGVGQYQHDMPQARLSDALSGVVEDCVNSVGADLNTASCSLLEHVAGVNSAIAKNIVAYREENGAFQDRRQLLKVPKLGAKAFEQCAGFLRVIDGKNPLDNTAVHPESYKAAEALLKKYGMTPKDYSPQKFSAIEFPEGDALAPLAEEIGIGVPTLCDIINELKKPGRDPRDELPAPLLRDGNIMELKDLKEGMEFTGTVRNVIDFGCFVDIGVHEDGLVHISQICDRFIKHPLEAVKVGQTVKVRVLSVDVARKRISLTMKL